MKILVKKEVEVNKTDIHWTYGNTQNGTFNVKTYKKGEG